MRRIDSGWGQNRQNHECRTAWATIIGLPSDFGRVMSASDSSSVRSSNLFPDFPLTVHIILHTVCFLLDKIRVCNFISTVYLYSPYYVWARISTSLITVHCSLWMEWIGLDWFNLKWNVLGYGFQFTCLHRPPYSWTCPWRRRVKPCILILWICWSHNVYKEIGLVAWFPPL